MKKCANCGGKESDFLTKFYLYCPTCQNKMARKRRRELRVVDAKKTILELKKGIYKSNRNSLTKVLSEGE